MRLHAVVAAASLGIGLFAVDPNVKIRNATVPTVVDALWRHLEPQGFVRGDITDKKATFSYDRGMVAQNIGGFLHIYMDINVRFKPTGSGLEVVATQELRGNTANHGSYDFRRPVRDRANLDKLQGLLELVRDELEATTPDSSTSP